MQIFSSSVALRRLHIITMYFAWNLGRGLLQQAGWSGSLWETLALVSQHTLELWNPAGWGAGLGFYDKTVGLGAQVLRQTINYKASGSAAPLITLPDSKVKFSWDSEGDCPCPMFWYFPILFFFHIFLLIRLLLALTQVWVKYSRSTFRLERKCKNLWVTWAVKNLLSFSPLFLLK